MDRAANLDTSVAASERFGRLFASAWRAASRVSERSSLAAVALSTALSIAALATAAIVAVGHARLSAGAIAAFEQTADELRRIDSELSLAALAVAADPAAEHWRATYERLAGARADLFARVVAQGGVQTRRIAAAGAADAATAAAIEREAMVRSSVMRGGAAQAGPAQAEPGPADLGPADLGQADLGRPGSDGFGAPGVLGSNKYVRLRARVVASLEETIDAAGAALTRHHDRNARVVGGVGALGLLMMLSFVWIWRGEVERQRLARRAVRRRATRKRALSENPTPAAAGREILDQPALAAMIETAVNPRRDVGAVGLLLVELAAGGAPVAGDPARQAANVLAQAVRRRDLVARLSPTRLALFIEFDTDVAGVAVLAERLVGRFSQTASGGETEDFGPVALGVATLWRDALMEDQRQRPGTTAGVLMRQAQIALEQARRRLRAEGRASAFAFYAETDRKILDRRRHLVSDIQAGLELSSFHADYAPIAAAGDGRLLGMAAALRWRHPTDGVLSSEETTARGLEAGLLKEIETSLLLQVVSDLESWAAQGLRPPRVCLSVSAERVLEPRFCDLAIELTRAPGRLALELGDGAALVAGKATGQAHLARLRAGGIVVGLDERAFDSLAPAAFAWIRPAYIRVRADSATAGDAALRRFKALRAFAASIDSAVLVSGVDAASTRRRLARLGGLAAVGTAMGAEMSPDQTGQYLGARRARSGDQT